MSCALNGGSAVRHFEGNDAVEMRDRIDFDFYTGLPQVIVISLPGGWSFYTLVSGVAKGGI